MLGNYIFIILFICVVIFVLILLVFKRRLDNYDFSKLHEFKKDLYLVFYIKSVTFSGLTANVYYYKKK